MSERCHPLWRPRCHSRVLMSSFWWKQSQRLKSHLSAKKLDSHLTKKLFPNDRKIFTGTKNGFQPKKTKRKKMTNPSFFGQNVWKIFKDFIWRKILLKWKKYNFCYKGWISLTRRKHLYLALTCLKPRRSCKWSNVLSLPLPECTAGGLYNKR